MTNKILKHMIIASLLFSFIGGVHERPKPGRLHLLRSRGREWVETLAEHLYQLGLEVFKELARSLKGRKRERTPRTGEIIPPKGYGHRPEGHIYRTFVCANV